MKAKILFCISAVFLAACSGSRQEPAAGKTGDSFEIAGYGKFTLNGPYSHKNVVIYFLDPVSPPQESQDFITLDEGMKAGTVKVTEKKDGAQVNTLQIENTSGKPLFIQAGDIVDGGQQDRTLQASLVIPPNSGVTDLPSFCVEHGRWSGDGNFTSNTGTLNSKELKLMARESKSQQGVWKAVEEQKKELREKIGGGDSASTSLNEETEAAKSKTDDYKKALSDALSKCPNAMGMVVAVDGEINSVHLYPAPSLFKKLYGKLVESFAIEAVASKTAKETAPDQSAVTFFLTDLKSIDGKSSEYGNGNGLVENSDKTKALFQHKYAGKPLHLEVLKK